MTTRLSVGAIALALASIACAEPLEFADWATPVPDGTLVHEYAPVPIAGRTEHIELVEDLVIGERDGDDNYVLYETRRVLVADGKIFVHDSGNVRVQVFDADGDYVMTIGREGQGPEEFSQFFGIAIAGNQLRVQDFGNRRVGVWTLDGEHLGELPYPSGPSPGATQGLEDGTILGSVLLRDGDEDALATLTTPRYALTAYGSEFEVLREIHEWPRISVPMVVRETSFTGISMRTARPRFVSTKNGQIYTTGMAEYQIRAFAPDATLRWALRVAWPRAPIQEHEIVAALERARRRVPDASRSEVEWPEAHPALSNIQVDGHGHLYVYPQRSDPRTPESEDIPEKVPVDVYSADGERLFSGLIRALRWSDVEGDFVYTSDTNEDTGEERIIRYRLVEPF